ncbi:MAG: hypothetical protein KatS3mg014_2573 [Actinomycetota bacterium]|nr:MAG: hypothetical protein KatS3mg014_2573 [Actinomycetota bacterium]
MTAPPVRRLVATAGLLVLAPVGAMLALGELSPEDAAVRAAVTLVICLVVARAISAGLRSLVATPPPVAGEAPGAGGAAVAQRGNASSAASTTTGSNAEPAS